MNVQNLQTIVFCVRLHLVEEKTIEDIRNIDLYIGMADLFSVDWSPVSIQGVK